MVAFVETMHASSPTAKIPTNSKSVIPKNQQMAAISPKSGSVSRIIGSYKSAITKYVHSLGYDFEWQSRFYDHILRDENEYFRISNYIKNNPKKWVEDKFH